MDAKRKLPSEMRLQCPRCQRLLERSFRACRCPEEHVQLSITPEGYLRIETLETPARQLHYGGEFREGLLWRKMIRQSKKVVYVAAPGEEKDKREPLQDYLRAQGREVQIVTLEELKRYDIVKRTPIVFSHRVGWKNAVKLRFKYPRHSLYRYFPDSVTREGWLQGIEKAMRGFLYRFFLTPLVSRRVERLYEWYLSDRTTAEQFALSYLPSEMHNGKGRLALDIGCGRGRHIAILNQLGFAVTGMNPEPHSFWRRIPGASFIIGNTDCLRCIPDETLDLVVCMQVLMYLSDDGMALAETRRILKRGGYLLLQVTNADNLRTFITQHPLIEDPYLQNYYHEAELSKRLEQSGFNIERIWMEKVYFPFFVSLGNIFYEFVLNTQWQAILDRCISPRHLGLINILARPKKEGSAVGTNFE